MYKVTHLTEFEDCGRFHGRMSYDSLIFYLTVVLIPWWNISVYFRYFRINVLILILCFGIKWLPYLYVHLSFFLSRCVWSSNCCFFFTAVFIHASVSFLNRCLWSNNCGIFTCICCFFFTVGAYGCLVSFLHEFVRQLDQQRRNPEFLPRPPAAGGGEKILEHWRGEESHILEAGGLFLHQGVNGQSGE